MDGRTQPVLVLRFEEALSPFGLDVPRHVRSVRAQQRMRVLHRSDVCDTTGCWRGLVRCLVLRGWAEKASAWILFAVDDAGDWETDPGRPDETGRVYQYSALGSHHRRDRRSVHRYG